jgi:hypothetical protein
VGGGEVRVDHSRADAERRFKLLEMAKGSLEYAKELEAWVNGTWPQSRFRFHEVTGANLTIDPETGLPLMVKDV